MSPACFGISIPSRADRTCCMFSRVLPQSRYNVECIRFLIVLYTKTSSSLITTYMAKAEASAVMTDKLQGACTSFNGPALYCSVLLCTPELSCPLFHVGTKQRERFVLSRLKGCKVHFSLSMGQCWTILLSLELRTSLRKNKKESMRILRFKFAGKLLSRP